MKQQTTPKPPGEGGPGHAPFRRHRAMGLTCTLGVPVVWGPSLSAEEVAASLMPQGSRARGRQTFLQTSVAVTAEVWAPDARVSGACTLVRRVLPRFSGALCLHTTRAHGPRAHLPCLRVRHSVTGNVCLPGPARLGGHGCRGASGRPGRGHGPRLPARASCHVAPVLSLTGPHQALPPHSTAPSAGPHLRGLPEGTFHHDI